MALIDNISKTLGLGGKTPKTRLGVSADQDLHVQNGKHINGHTELDVKVQPKKYADLKLK